MELVKDNIKYDTNTIVKYLVFTKSGKTIVGNINEFGDRLVDCAEMVFMLNQHGQGMVMPNYLGDKENVIDFNSGDIFKLSPKSPYYQSHSQLVSGIVLK